MAETASEEHIRSEKQRHSHPHRHLPPRPDDAELTPDYINDVETWREYMMLALTELGGKRWPKTEEERQALKMDRVYLPIHVILRAVTDEIMHFWGDEGKCVGYWCYGGAEYGWLSTQLARTKVWIDRYNLEPGSPLSVNIRGRTPEETAELINTEIDNIGYFPIVLAQWLERRTQPIFLAGKRFAPQHAVEEIPF